MMITNAEITKLVGQFGSIAKHASGKNFKPDMAQTAIQSALDYLSLHATCDHIQDKQSLENLKNSIEILQNALKNNPDLKARLNDLSSRVNQLLKYGIIKERFVAVETATIWETVQKPPKQLFQFLTQSIADSINKMVYAGWAKKVKDENLKTAIENELTKKYQDWGQKAHAQAKTADQHRQINAALAIEMGFVPEAAKADPRMEKISAIDKKGEETRAQLVAIGGTRVELEAADGVKLDATYLSAGKFLTTLQRAGAQSGNVRLGNETAPAIIIPKHSASALKLLRELNLVTSSGKPGAGYCLISFPNDTENFYLMPDKTLDDRPEWFNNNQGNFNWYQDGTIASNYNIYWTDDGFKQMTTNLNDQNGAAILTSGNMGVYEMHKGEAMALLMQGMDVMMLNVRGYGQSEGKPSQDGSYLDIEAAYQYVKDKRQIDDSKIVAWSMCLSGGIAAHLVEKHPKMNLFLNQTYADLASMLKENISLKLQESGVEHPFVKSVLTDIIFFALSFIAPNYHVKDRLKNVKGHVCTVQALSDTLMGQKETAAMAKIMKEKGINHHRIEIPGEHCSNWTQALVPEISIQTTSGIIHPQMQDYLIVFDGDQSFYLPKEGLKSEKGVKIGSRQFTRPDPKFPHQIHVKKDNISSPIKAREVEVTDSRDFISHLKGSKGYQGFKFKSIGHEGVNGFLSAANLSRPLL